MKIIDAHLHLFSEDSAEGAYTSEYDSSAAPPAHRINRKLDICLFVSLFASIILIDID